jgi:hypothetical protein
MKRSLSLLGVVLMLSSFGAVAQVGRSHPGYYPIEEMSVLAPDEIEVSVDLQGAMLQLAAGALQQDDQDPDIAALVSKLERVRVLVGEPEVQDTAGIAARFDDAIAKMVSSGWGKILSVEQDEDERVVLLARESEDTIVGLTVLVSDGGEEVVLVNIVGTIDPELLGRVVAKADAIPKLEGLAGSTE